MATLLAFSDAVDIGHGRGRLAAPAAASLRRIDAQLGRLADVNEGWRSPADADANYASWIAYQNGTGPKAPLALPASQSIHCRGFAADSDDWYNSWAAGVWYHNGWRQTARYPGTNRDEPWHGEYFAHLDNNYGQPASGGSVAFPTPGVTPDVPPPPPPLWETEDKENNMFLVFINDEAGKFGGGVIYALTNGEDRWIEFRTQGAANTLAKRFGDAAGLSYDEWPAFRAAAAGAVVEPGKA